MTALHIAIHAGTGLVRAALVDVAGLAVVILAALAVYLEVWK